MTHFSPLKYSLKIQLLACILFSLIGLYFGKVHAYSLLLGTLLFVVPNLYFTYYAFRYSGSDWAIWIKHSFMWGEMGKQSLTAVGFALVYNFVAPLHHASLFTGFVLMILVQWWLSIRIANIVAAASKEPKPQ